MNSLTFKPVEGKHFVQGVDRLDASDDVGDEPNESSVDAGLSFAEVREALARRYGVDPSETWTHPFAGLDKKIIDRGAVIRSRDSLH